MGVFDGYAGDAQAQVPQPSAAAPSGGGGLAHFLYSHLVEPTVKSVAAIPGDVAHTGAALGTVGGSILSGHHGAQLAADKQKALDQIRQTTAGKSLPSTVAGVKSGSLGQQLEQIAGNTGSQALAAAAPAMGLETSGVKGLATLGAKLGAAGGVSNAAAQGGGGEQLLSGGLTGGATGAVAGAAGGAVGNAIGRLTRGKTTPTISGETQPSGMLAGTAKKAGAKAAQNIKASQEGIDFSAANAAGRTKEALSYDKQGNPVGLTQVSSFLRGLGMDGSAQNMKVLNETSSGVLGGNLKDITDGVPINVGSPTDIGRKAIMDNQGLLGSIGRTNKSGAAGDALAQIRDATSNLNENSTVSDVLGAISNLEKAKSDLGSAVTAGNPKAKGQVNAYQTVLDHLHNTLDSAGVNKAVSDFRVSPTLESQIREDVASNGGTPQLAQHYIDTLDNASGYSKIRSEMQHGVVGGNLSRIAQEAYSNAVPQAAKGAPAGMPSWELAAGMRNPAYLALYGSKLAEHTGMIDRGLAKINPNAYNAGKAEGLAPDAVTAQKLARPGGASTPPTIAPEPQAQAPLPTEQPSIAPAEQSVPPVSGAGEGPTRLSFPAADTTTPIPTRAAAGNVDSLLQNVGVRRTVFLPGEGPAVNGISGPVKPSGTVMGAEPQPAVGIPTRTTPEPTVPLTASSEVPLATRVAPEEPVGPGQASGPIPVSVAPPAPPRSFSEQNPLISSIAPTLTGGVDTAAAALSQAPAAVGNVAKTLGNVTKGAAKLPGKAVRSVVNNPSSLIGALTGNAAVASGEGTANTPAAPPEAPPITPMDNSATTDNTATAASGGVSDSQLQQMMTQALANPDAKTQAAQLAIIKQLKDLNAPAKTTSTTGKITAAQQGMASSGLSSLAQMRTAIARNPNTLAQANVPGQSLPLVGGYITGLTGVGDYTSAAANTLDALARVRTGAAMTKSEEKFYHGLLPKAGDSPSVVNQKLDQLQQAFTQFVGAP